MNADVFNKWHRDEWFQKQDKDVELYNAQFRDAERYNRQNHNVEWWNNVNRDTNWYSEHQCVRDSEWYKNDEDHDDWYENFQPRNLTLLHHGCVPLLSLRTAGVESVGGPIHGFKLRYYALPYRLLG